MDKVTWTLWELNPRPFIIAMLMRNENHTPRPSALTLKKKLLKWDNTSVGDHAWLNALFSRSYLILLVTSSPPTTFLHYKGITVYNVHNPRFHL